MTGPLRYIIVGTGGFGGAWCREFLPRLTKLGKAVPVAAVDISPDALANARKHLELPAAKCYTDLARAFDENPADLGIVVVPPAHHEQI
ncbi:MAG TPA: gfo/Idh/MocA family oxidoreductase, partial [Planctomycetota bacterium]|nr:gfo/Idh/MocA family oxidoreductase [Planctomycetota bacterium]